MAGASEISASVSGSPCVFLIKFARFSQYLKVRDRNMGKSCFSPAIRIWFFKADVAIATGWLKSPGSLMMGRVCIGILAIRTIVHAKVPRYLLSARLSSARRTGLFEMTRTESVAFALCPISEVPVLERPASRMRRDGLRVEVATLQFA